AVPQVGLCVLWPAMPLEMHGARAPHCLEGEVSDTGLACKRFEGTLQVVPDAVGCAALPGNEEGGRGAASHLPSLNRSMQGRRGTTYPFRVVCSVSPSRSSARSFSLIASSARRAVGDTSSSLRASNSCGLRPHTSKILNVFSARCSRQQPVHL